LKKPPTDRELLKLIYESYYDEFNSYDEDTSERSTKLYVPIDCVEIAKQLDVDEDIVFGRLYYHLDKKYGYTQDDGVKVHLFSMRINKDRHVIHFPLLSAVLAELEQSNFRFVAPITLSLIALAFSIFAFAWGIKG